MLPGHLECRTRCVIPIKYLARCYRLLTSARMYGNSLDFNDSQPASESVSFPIFIYSIYESF